jgi:CRISPR-associated protein Csx16
MSTIIVTRHAGAIEWLRREFGLVGDKVVAHITAEEVAELKYGDKVVGVLPIHLAVAIHQQDARVLLVQMPAVPQEARGRELTPEDMARYGAGVLELCIEEQCSWTNDPWVRRVGAGWAHDTGQVFRIGLVPYEKT